MGNAEEQAGHLEAALVAYEAAYASALEPSASNANLEALARVHFALRHWTEAYDAYAKLALALGTSARPAIGVRLRELALTTGVISIAANDVGAQVYLDGVSLGTAPLHLARRVLVGPHLVRETSEDKTLYTKTVEVSPGSVVIVDAHVRLAHADATDSQPPPDDQGASHGEAWQITHGSKQYIAKRTEASPTIDGILDEAMWATAAKDERFLTTRSKPYGQVSNEPTSVQLVYDEKNIYVAFRCRYSTQNVARDNTFAPAESDVGLSDSVTVLIDPLHNHNSAYAFAVSRVGSRADSEITNGGALVNGDWRGIWDVATSHSANEWTAEFRIPWGTMRMPAHPSAFDVGINFARNEPGSGDFSLWALHPPATQNFDTNFFGHLSGLKEVYPGQRLYIEPYVAFGFDQNASTKVSPLIDFTGASGLIRPYAGIYARYQPPGPLRFDATINPNFAGANPDQAVTNLDRFELEYPENRAFFANDNPRFAFGAPRYSFGDFGAQLFYSRRIGIATDAAGISRQLPTLWGGKAVLRSGGTDVALMNSGLAPPAGAVSIADNITAARMNQTVVEGSRVGAIFLARTGSGARYLAGGVDGEYSLFERHLRINGFYAQSSSSKLGESGSGQATLTWRSQDFYGSASYVDIGKNFDAQLGYFPITGLRGQIFAVGYTPVLRNDLVQQLSLEAQLNEAQDRNGARIYQRGTISASITTPTQANVYFHLSPAIEEVAQPFAIANGRVTIGAGSHKVLVTEVYASTAQRRPVIVGVGVVAGDLFDGHQVVPQLGVGLNLGRLSSGIFYHLYAISYGVEDFIGHQLSVSTTYAFSPLAKSTLNIEANTLSARAVAQLVTSYTFGTLSTLSFVLREDSGVSPVFQAREWYERPGFSAVVSFALGVTPF